MTPKSRQDQKEYHLRKNVNYQPATLPLPSSDTATSAAWGHDSNFDRNITVSNPSIRRIICDFGRSEERTSSWLARGRIHLYTEFESTDQRKNQQSFVHSKGLLITSATPLAVFLSSSDVFLPIHAKTSSPQSRM